MEFSQCKLHEGVLGSRQASVARWITVTIPVLNQLNVSIAVGKIHLDSAISPFLSKLLRQYVP